ncbi:MAG: hypothetical protein ABIH76_06335 [Candidatus Bathyarchaeota archaeon]
MKVKYGIYKIQSNEVGTEVKIDEKFYKGKALIVGYTRGWCPTDYYPMLAYPNGKGDAILITSWDEVCGSTSVSLEKSVMSISLKALDLLNKWKPK